MKQAERQIIANELYANLHLKIAEKTQTKLEPADTAFLCSIGFINDIKAKKQLTGRVVR